MIQNIFLPFINSVSNSIELGAIPKIDKRFVHKINPEYVLISDIKEIPREFLNDFPESEDNQLLYTTAHPKYDCEFCFDHPLDHLPFIMISEISRQIGLAITHMIDKVPLQEYSSIIDDFKINMHKFIELDIPIIITIENIILKKKQGRYNKFMRMYFYQNQTLCTTIEINACIMLSAIYSKLRLNFRGEMVKNKDLCKTPVTNIDVLTEKRNLNIQA